MTTDTTIHCFEAAGLGKAPFRYIGIEYQDMAYGQRLLSRDGAMVTTKPGGSCAYCDTYIVNMFNVESADGKRFHVGCECIRKTDDAGLIRKVDEAVKAMERDKRRAKKEAKVKAAEAYCRDVRLNQLGTLSQLPHPTPERAARGEKLADYVLWMIDHGCFETLANVLKFTLKAD